VVPGRLCRSGPVEDRAADTDRVGRASCNREGGKVEFHHRQQQVHEALGPAEREMVDEPQGQGRLDGQLRVPPLPASHAAPPECPAGNHLRCRPERHIAAAHEGLVVGWPVRNAVLHLAGGMNLRPHPRSVAPADSSSRSDHAPHPRRVFMRQRLAVGPPARTAARSSRRRGHNGERRSAAGVAVGPPARATTRSNRRCGHNGGRRWAAGVAVGPPARATTTRSSRSPLHNDHRTRAAGVVRKIEVAPPVWMPERRVAHVLWHTGHVGPQETVQIEG
jgi:hypothetical protein